MNLFTMSFHLPGTLAANVLLNFKTPQKAKLVHVSAVASNDSDATLKIGNSTDDDAYLVAGVIGDTATPVEKVKADFVNAKYPSIPKGTTVVATLDFDGAAGTAAQNVTIVLTFQIASAL